MPRNRVFPTRLTNGGFLTIGYCFPYCFLKIFVGNKALMERNKVVMGDPPSLPTRENPEEIVGLHSFPTLLTNN